MKHVICTLPNASTLINGVKFAEKKLEGLEKAVMHTVEAVEDHVAEFFNGIPGYKVLPVSDESSTKKSDAGKAAGAKSKDDKDKGGAANGAKAADKGAKPGEVTPPVTPPVDGAPKADGEAAKDGEAKDGEPKLV